MKRIFATILCLCLLAGLGTVFASAEISDHILDDTWKDLKLETLVRTTVEGTNAYYDCDWANNENYLTSDEEEEGYAITSLRGAAISPDGKYLFAGYLNGGTVLADDGKASSATYMIDPTNGGKTLATYYRRDANNYLYYTKGLSVDDRGYLYVGLAFSDNYNLVNLDIVKVDYENYTMTAVNKEPIEVCKTGTPGDSSGTSMGINGVQVVKVGESYYLYVVVNYGIDRLYKYDVTNPENPTLVSTYGSDQGYLELSTATVTSNLNNTISVDDANYLACASDGTVYLASKIKNGAQKFALIKISADGQMQSAIEMEDAFAVALYEEYAVVTAKTPAADEYAAVVINVETNQEVAKIMVPEDEDTVQIVYAAIQNDILYLVEQGDTGISSAFYAVGLTNNGAAAVKAMMTPTADADPDGDKETTADPDGQTTADPDGQTTADPDGQTTADPDGQTTAGPAATTASTEEPGGCGSMVAVSAICLPVIALAALTLRKKED